MKNMINTIGKIIHTLVKENTPHAVIKYDRNVVSLKRSHFTTYHCNCVFILTVVRILVERLDLCLHIVSKKFKYTTPGYPYMYMP